MLSKGHIKLVAALSTKKQRQKQGLFVVEGTKIILESIKAGIKVKTIFATNTQVFENCNLYSDQLLKIEPEDLRIISSLQAPSESLAVLHQPNLKKQEDSKICLFLDQIQDPGNLGTIIRIADWYGINKIYCQKGTVDLFNCKTLQATMGSYLRVQLEYLSDVASFFRNNSKQVFGTFLKGENIYTTDLNTEAIIVIGNEGNGISEEIAPFIQKKITIPKIGGAESLNAGVATAITLDNFFRH